MKKVINFEKKHLYFFLFGIGIIILFGFVMAFNSNFPSQNANPALFGHSSDEVLVKTPANVSMTLQTALDGNEFWGWRKSGSDVFYTGGNVGIGNLSPTTGKLVVSGGNVDVTNNKLINLATPIASSDAANKGYVDAQSTGGGGIFPVYGTTTCPTGWSKAYDGYITTFTVGVPNIGVTGSSLCVQQSAIISISGYSQGYTSGRTLAWHQL